jgi:NAD(P)H dehydrogenase (quinone)
VIVVTGGNGQLGRAIAERLEHEMGPTAFRLSVREVDASDPRLARGVEIRAANYDDPAALARSFEGAEQVVLISADGVDDVRLPRQLNAVRAAKDAGLRTSCSRAAAQVGKAPGLSHAEVNARTEEAIAATGVPYTILRNNLYAELLLMFAGPAIATAVIRLPAGHGRAAMISRADIASFVVRAMRSGLERNRTYELTGPAAFGYGDLASVLSQKAGRTVAYEPSSSERSIEWLRGRLPVPDVYLPFIVEAAREFGEGWLSDVSSDFEDALGTAAVPAVDVWRRGLA